jgi:NAD(P)H-quinone oxidoreductase subunit 5
MYVDKLTFVMFFLIGFISFVVWSYSKTYMQGEKRKVPFLSKIILLGSAVSIMVAADNIILLLAALACSNILLISLMTNNDDWQAARASGVLAARYLSLSFVCLASGFYIFYSKTNHYKLQEIITLQVDLDVTLALIIIFVGAMIQSAQWPFNRWLISSLNSPTPVSAMMHAGIINGGGFILIRLAPLYLKTPGLLSAIFIIGFISALIGTLLKLAQNDYKRMLACSTMGQMGFMIMQCGLGLFSLAIAHVCWHGIFKAYLFLISGSASQGHGHANAINQSPKTVDLLLALVIGGIFGSYVFLLSSAYAPFSLDANLFIKGVVFIAGTQLALTILTATDRMRILVSVLVTACVATLYGLSVKIFHNYLEPLNIDSAQSLGIFHALAYIVLFLGWLSIVYRSWIGSISKLASIRNKFYVWTLNAGQPHEATITASRHSYNY